MKNNNFPTGTLFDRIGGRTGLLLFLRHFYADVRQEKVIGPIFSKHIHDWPAHIEKIADFWSGITGGPVLYGGGMPQRHIPLELEEKHFQSWLGLWQRHCHIHFPPLEASEMNAAAVNIGLRLRAIVGVHSGRDIPSALIP